jgi:hypothetical protein
MHDDTCNAMARGTHSGLTVHCWLPLNHPGDHLDRDLNIYWHRGPNGPGALVKQRPMLPWGKQLSAWRKLAAVG